MLGPIIGISTTGSIQKTLISQSVNYGIKNSSGKSISEHAASAFIEEIRNCETIHTASLNQIFFETLDEIDCKISQ